MIDVHRVHTRPTRTNACVLMLCGCVGAAFAALVVVPLALAVKVEQRTQQLHRATAPQLVS
jgi:hypothetical protein